STPTPTPMPTPTPSPTPLPTPDGAQFYVSPTGSSGGDGSIGNPWGLGALTTYGVVPAGATVSLRGGTYDLDFTPNTSDGATADQTWFWMAGTPTNPIIVRPYPGERPKIALDYTLHLNGSYVHWYEIEFLDAKTDRTAYGGWAWPRPGNLSLGGEYIKLINCVIHEVSNIPNRDAATGNEFHGCLLYYNGLVDSSKLPSPPGQPAGNSNYFQNASSVEKKLINNIFFTSTQNVIQASGTDAAWITNLTMEGNTFFGVGKLAAGNEGQNVIVWPGDVPARNIKFNDNYLYHSTNDKAHLNFPGSSGQLNFNLEMKNNRLVGGGDAAYLGQWEPLVFTGNKIWNRYKAVTVGISPLPTNTTRHIWNNNTYNFLEAAGDQNRVPFTLNSVPYEFAAWKTATGFDTNSTYTEAPPTGIEIYIRPNAYTQGRANITIFNFSLAATANINLSTTGLTNGQQYQIKDAQNFFGPAIYTGTYSTTSPTINVTLPGAGSPVTPLGGANDPANNGYIILPTHTSVEFNVFVLLPR
ncbi:MAG: hypothetical protein LC778_09415, partial [Acidobacteria bacterium]|nr:hypothetical protein [Acidobacteriota bacterium]